ncbi:MAG: DUF3276 family protein [Spirochaetales bacterium]|nr:DUF3276 family protein [Spirochaetales bacterium]
MGRRGEIFTRKIFVKDGDKTYFFNIKENRYGDKFLNLVESSKKETEFFIRNSIMIYQEDLIPFMEGFTLSQNHLKKRDKTKLTLSRGNETGRRTFHFSVKWNKFGWGSIFISEERGDQGSELHNEMILIDERDMEDFLKGYEPAMAKMKRMKDEAPAVEPQKKAAKPVKVKISIAHKEKKPLKKEKVTVRAKKEIID